MQFDVDGLALQFNNLINFTLTHEYGPEIKGYIGNYKKRRDDFLKETDPKDAYREMIRTKLTNGLYRELDDNRMGAFVADFEPFFVAYKQNGRTAQVANQLANIIQNHSFFKLGQGKAEEWVKDLFYYENLNDFTQNLYNLRKDGKKSKILGDKGADHYLRGVGHFDIIPIDLHERRFLIRTGIWHLFNIKDQDPIGMRSLQEALSQFCLYNLKDKSIEGIDLGSSPGVVDLVIWSYCSDQGYNKCGKMPECSGCKLEKACFLGVANTERRITQQTSVHKPKY